jgi:hypothetical protein
MQRNRRAGGSHFQSRRSIPVARAQARAVHVALNFADKNARMERGGGDTFAL